jgi:hypothetical protein
MSGDYHYDAAWERIVDLQREAENRRLVGQAYRPVTSAALRNLVAWTGAAFVRAGAAMNRWAQPIEAACDEGAAEVA